MLWTIASAASALLGVKGLHPRDGQQRASAVFVTGFMADAATREGSSLRSPELPMMQAGEQTTHPLS